MCTAILHRSRLIIKGHYLHPLVYSISVIVSTNYYVTLSKLGNYVRTKSVSYCDIEDSLGTSKKAERIGTTGNSVSHVPWHHITCPMASHVPYMCMSLPIPLASLGSVKR